MYHCNFTLDVTKISTVPQKVCIVIAKHSEFSENKFGLTLKLDKIAGIK